MTYTWIQRPRADLRMAVVGESVADRERIIRAERDPDAVLLRNHWYPEVFVRLTNYGDGTAYDILLSGGSECRPRVWVEDMGEQKMVGEPPITTWPMWSRGVSALEPGDSVTVVVVCSADSSRPKPVLVATWPRFLPGRGLGRRKREINLADAQPIEMGWPGKSAD